ncbi:MAG: hypothetical protein QM765_38455 [Myxococcales bacterium]
MRRWYLDQLTKRGVAVDPSARTTLQIELPVVEERRGEACMVLAARVICDEQDFSVHAIESMRCYPGPVDKAARAALSLAGLAASFVTTQRIPVTPDPEDAPIEKMRDELVELIALASR